MITGSDIKTERLRQGLSQKALAEMLGYKSASIIGKAEKGEAKEDILEKLGEILGIAGSPALPVFYTIYTDGGCEKNPGGKGGYGVVMINERTKVVTEMHGGFISTTNNRMEIYAAIKACEALPEGSAAVIYTDSQYLLNTVNGNYRIRKNHDLWKRLKAAMKDKQLEFKWVKGHDDNKLNERCDDLALIGYTEGALAEDKGYIPDIPVRKEESNSGKAAEYSHTYTPKEMPQASAEVSNEDIQKYALEKGVTPECAKAILSFNTEEKHKFKSYTKLKTGGFDKWSQKFYSELRKEFPLAAGIIEKHLDTNNEVASALRWYARGLSIPDSIRKVQVDNEIRENANKKGGLR